MRFVVTGAAGFIGSNLIRGLNARGYDDIIAVDNLTREGKFANLVDCRISDYFEKGDFLPRLAAGALGSITAIFHEGACSDTMEHDGHYMIENNYRYSKDLLDICTRLGTRLLYASSAAVYGNSTNFAPEPINERPLNVYGYSKLLFDNVVRRLLPEPPVQIAGFRYFNVYGPREQHKGRMASVAFHHMNQMREQGFVRLFGGYDGYAEGEQSRDFIFVEDLVKVKLWFLDNPHVSGIFNLGTGRAQPFNDIAHAVVNGVRARDQAPPLSLAEQVAQGLVRYVEFPEALKGKYQSFTQADIAGLRAAGYEDAFLPVDEGVGRYATKLFAD